VVATTLSFLMLRSLVFRGTKILKLVVHINILRFPGPLNYRKLPGCSLALAVS
jgi:hypothetical protein